MDYFSELNERQREAVTHKDGPILIIAGAGAGKTKTLTCRIHHLVQGGVPPEKILAVTFTNKAAREMRERLDVILGHLDEVGGRRGLRAPFIGTFHALGAHILRSHAARANLHPHFSIADRDDSLSAIKDAMKLSSIDPKRFEPRKILSAISRQKGNLISLESYAADSSDFLSKIIATVWGHYDELLKRGRSLDFDDLLVRPVNLLTKDQKILENLQNEWLYIHVDEYQDTNAAQYELTSLLSGARKNLCVVGDSDQSIYSWRGADFGNMLNFERDYPGAAVVTLEENYRSTQTILRAANNVISRNVMRKEKNLFTKNKVGEVINLYVALDETDEATFVAASALRLIKNEGVDPGEIAVLYRANFQSRALEEAFLAEEIPYQVLGVRFFERKEIKDILSYIKGATNPSDFVSVARALSVPKRGLGKIALAKIIAGQTSQLPLRQRESVTVFLKLLDDIRTSLETLPTSKVIKMILERSGILSGLKSGSSDEKERAENIEELVTLGTHYDSHNPPDGTMKLIEESMLSSGDEDGAEKPESGVKLMTAHASKGLEFSHVFVTGLEEGLFPHGGLDNEGDPEEERRLFYVALTRAKEKLSLSYAMSRTIYGSRRINIPSEFISDIDPSLIAMEEGGERILDLEKL